MLLAFAISTLWLHDALLDVDLSHLGASSGGHAFRTGTPQMAAPQLLPAISCHPSDNGAAGVGGCIGVSAFEPKLSKLMQKI
jgi:hypothetical protein